MADEKVLVVEDELNWQRELASMLNGAGHRVRVAGNYSEALWEIRKGIIKVAIIDLNLDQDNRNDRAGVELMKAIRIPVVVVSGVMGPDEGAKFLKEGLVDGFFLKKDFQKQVDKFLARVDESARKFEADTREVLWIPGMIWIMSLCAFFFAVGCIVSYMLLDKLELYPAILCYISVSVSIELGLAGLLIHRYMKGRILWRR